MALTKDQLRTENQNSFPDNTDGLITPQILRDYNDDVIDSLVVSADTGSLVTTTTFNDFSQSTDSRLDNIETTTSSLQTQIDNIDTGSLLETASVNLNTITFTKADASTFDITVDTGSAGGTTDITALNEFTSSQLTINSGYNTFTESTDSRLDNIELATGSYATTGSNIFTANQIISGTLDVEQTFTASLTQGNIYVGDATGTTSEIATGSLSVSSSLDAQDLIIGVKNTSLVTLPKGTPVYATGVTGENINIESASNASSATMPAIGILNEELTPNSAGFAILSGRIIGVDTNGFTAGNNIYVGVDGTFTETKPTGTALIQNIGVVGKVDASDGEIVVIGSGRSNDLPNITEGYLWIGNGDGVATAYSTGSLNFALTNVNNTFTGTQSFNNISVSGTGSFGYIESVTGSAKIIGDAFLILNNDTPTERYAGIKIIDSGSTGATASLQFDGQTNDWFYEYTSSGDPDNFGVVLFGPEYNTIGSPTYLSNNTIPKSDGGHHLNDSSITDVGSQVIVANPLDVQGNITTTGTVDGVDIQSLDSQVNTNTNDIVSLKLATASLETSVNALNSYTQSTDGRLTNIELTTASFDGRLNNIELTTASLDSSISQLNTFSGSTEGRLNNIELATGSYATTGSNTFTSNQIISGTLDIEGTISASLGEGLVLVGDANGRTVTVETSSFGGGGGGFPFEGDAQISGSLGVTGSMSGFVNALSITSNTASVDFNDGNMFTLTLASSADTHINPTNIKAGQTINIQITQPATSGSISFAPTVLFAGNAAFEATQTGSAVDMVTLVSFDGTNVLATGIKNFE